jgi:hypothetical protein
MENLPKNVINKIMFYTSHPVVDILKASSIFKALEMDIRYRIHGSPFDRGDMDAYYGRGYEPHKKELHLGRMVQFELETDEELKEYEAAYFHSSNRKCGRNRIQNEIFKNYGYMRVYCIRPIWTLTREEEKCEDEYTDSDSS